MKSWKVTLSDTERRALRNLLYGISAGAYFSGKERAQAGSFEYKLAPRVLREQKRDAGARQRRSRIRAAKRFLAGR